MNNKDLYYDFKEYSQKYLLIFYSLIDYFNELTQIKNVNGENYETLNEYLRNSEDIINLSFFLASLKLNGWIKNLFNSYDITFGNCIDVFSNDKVKFELKKSIDDIKCLNKINLKESLSRIVGFVSDEFGLNDGELHSSDLEPFIFFDSAQAYYEHLNSFLKCVTNEEDIFDDKMYEKYSEISANKYTQFFKSIGIKLNKSTSNDKVYRYCFDSVTINYCNNMLILITKGGKSIFIPVKNENYELNNVSNIIEINGKPICDEIFQEFINTFDSNEKFNFTVERFINGEKVKKIIDFKKENLFGSKKIIDAFKDGSNDSIVKNNEENKKNNNSEHKELNKLSKDLTKVKYLKDPSVGREEEIRKIEQVLCYPEHDRGIIIVGDAGVGKTALVEGLAYRIQNGLVPNVLKNKKIISIDISSIVSGTKYVGSLEEKMNKILNQIIEDGNIILFIDEMHQAIGAGKSEGNDNSIAEILKPFLTSGKLGVIGATTTNEYNKYMLENEAFKSRFKRINLSEPNEKVIYGILDNLITAYNKISYSKFNFSDEEKRKILNILIEATNKKNRNYLDTENNPRLVLGILKEVFANATLNDKEEISVDDICASLLSEDRLYPNVRKKYADMLKHILEQKKEEKSKILEFKLKSKDC